jgi:hypothetical protein
LVLAFGNRLWLHHAALLLPVLYAALALALTWLVERTARWPRATSWAAVAAVAPLLAANTLDRQAVAEQLRATGGVALASDAIIRFAQDSLLVSEPTQMFFPDWGVFMSFVMLTRGSIPYVTDFSPEAARTALCSGKDAVVVLVAGSVPERLASWISEVQWGVPDVTAYNQRDGVPVLSVVRWRAAAHPTEACPG